jgi:hypothetical protein
MPWHVQLITDHPIVETTYSGVLTKAEMKQSMDDALNLAKRHATTLFLRDCTSLEGIQSIADLYVLTGSLGIKSNIFKTKKAILLPSAQFSSEQVVFWRDACRTRKIFVELFKDRQGAIDWLQSDQHC